MAKKKKIVSNKLTKVKKRKVGRPKKRGRKKKYYTPKKKLKKLSKKGSSRNLTYSRVRSVLWTNFKDDFESYRLFIANKLDEQGNKVKGTSIVSQVYSQCKSLDCNDSDIIEIYNQFKNQNPNDEKPILPLDYYDNHYYWELETEDWWSGFDSRIWVVSPMLLSDPDNFLGILGSDRYVDANGELINRRFDGTQGDYIIYGKSQRFKEFINYCNQMQSQGLLQGTENQPNWRFVGENDDDEEVFWNRLTNRWEIRIVICEPNGDRGDVNDYDFDPTEPDREFDENLINQIVNRENVEQPIEEPIEEIDIIEEPKTGLSKEEIKIKKKELEQEDRRIKLEEDRSERINKLLQKFIDDKIDAETLERLLKLI